MASTGSTPHETNELRPVLVTVDGQPATTGVEFSLTAYNARPVTWTAAEVRDGKTLVRISGLAAGLYRVWARCTRGDEVAVLDCGNVSLT